MQVRRTWTELKGFVDNRTYLSLQYNQAANAYYVFATEGTITWYAEIAIEGTPGADQTDFEDNYKSGANQRVYSPEHVNTLIYGQKNVTTAGTRVFLIDGTTKTHTITIKAKSTNTGNIYVGDVAVTSANGFILEPGTTMSIDHDNKLDNVYIDAATSGEGVSYVGGSQV